MVPRSFVYGAGNGGVAILPNTDTHNWAVVLLVCEQRLAGLNIPHPEW